MTTIGRVHVKVIIKDQEYDLITLFKNDDKLRNAYNTLTEKVFEFNFEQFYKDGYWEDGYIPYSLMRNEKIIANVSVTVMSLSLLGEEKRYIQIGTVMTDPEYRGLGLSKCLMKIVLSEWKDKCDLIFLFANKTVLDFYPKFGFDEISEFQFSREVETKQAAIAASKLNMSISADREFVANKVKNASTLSSIYVKGCSGIVMFYCSYFMTDNVYYIEHLDTVVIAEYKGDELFLKGVFAGPHICIDQIIDALCTQEINKVSLGYTPIDNGGFNVEKISDPEDTLFVLGEKSTLLNNKVMFPVLYHT